MKKNNIEMPFEVALNQLEDIVKKLEEGKLDLNDSLVEFQKGIELYNYCHTMINNIEGKVNVIMENNDGQTIELEFDTEN